jgi:outer membrane biogenesis lipoprotein LolB
MKLQMHFLLIAATALLFSCASHQKSAATANTNQVQKTVPTATQASTDTTKKVTAQSKVKGHSCKRDSEVRTVWTEALQPKGCKLWYSNHSDKDPVASSRNGNEHCLNVEDRIVKNLSDAGYTCADN